MFKIKVPILEVTPENTKSDYIITEQACKNAVENYRNIKDVPVLIGNNVVGRVTSLEMESEGRAVMANIDLYISFVSQCSILQNLETPDGKVVLDLKIGAVQVQPEQEPILDFIKVLKQNGGQEDENAQENSI